MGSKQYKLVLEVLKRLDNEGVLSQTVLIGSWCLLLYKDYFKSNLSLLRTRDLDFLCPRSMKVAKKINVPEILKDLGFIQEFVYPQGYIKLMHPELIVEFLVPEKGKGRNKPCPLPQLGMNAQSLRFLDLLIKNTIQLELEGVKVLVPHPAYFAIHKLIVTQRRDKKEKALKDIQSASAIIKLLLERGQKDMVQEAFQMVSNKWQNKIRDLLRQEKELDILNVLA